MLYGLHTSGLGAMAQSVRMDVIANNLANVNTPAFRRDQISFRERLVEALEDRPDLRYYNALVDRHGGAPFIDSIHYDKQAGGYEMTGRTLDVSISGEGYFAVRERGGEGDVLYTRAGNFQLDSTGRLVTADGRYEVLSDDLAAIQLEPGRGTDLVIDANGTIYQEGEAVTTLSVQQFEHPELLFKRGETLYESRGATAVPAENLRVDQGFLESSSSDPLSEMVEMVKAMRSLEANLQMVQHQDATLDRLVNDFGRLPQG